LSPIGFLELFRFFVLESSGLGSSLVIWRAEFKDENGLFVMTVLARPSEIPAMSARSATVHVLKNLRTLVSNELSPSDIMAISDSVESESTSGKSSDSAGEVARYFLPLISLDIFGTKVPSGRIKLSGEPERVFVPLINRLRGFETASSGFFSRPGNFWLAAHLS
jgi:hypothetical protein